MTRQMDIFSQPVAITSDEFIGRLAVVLMRRSGVSHSEAFELCKKAVGGRLCPVCGSLIKVYTRKLNKGMVRVLRQLHCMARPVKSSDLNARGGDYAKLPHFGLVSLDENGLWSITQAGRDFLDGFGASPSYVAIFMDELVGVSVASCKYLGTVDDFNLDHITPVGVERVYIK